MVFPLLILLTRPLDMDWRQSLVVSTILLVIIWWSTNVVSKIPASLFLLGVFTVTGSAPLQTVFSFPLSESFFLIVLTYLFSQVFSNSGLVDKLFEPLLLRFSNTPLKTLAAIILMYVVTMYIIPQPLARLIIIAILFRRYLMKTNASVETREVLMFACFLFYAVVNMATRDADIIMNIASLGFAGLSMSDGQWARYMAVPVAALCLVIVALFSLFFKRQLFGIRFTVDRPADGKRQSLTKREKLTLAVIIVTVALWMTEGIHGVSSTVVTFCSVLVLFSLRVLELKDFKAIDVTTLVFLTAAFSIGGVMKASGVAYIVFERLQWLFPAEYSPLYLSIMILVSMAMHMILGSNTTTLSVIIPGLMVLCGDVLQTEVIMFVAYISVAFHSILPFHSAAMMIGVGNGYFPTKYVVKFGIPVTFIVLLAALFIFVPWWRLMGLL